MEYHLQIVLFYPKFKKCVNLYCVKELALLPGITMETFHSIQGMLKLEKNARTQLLLY